MTVSTPSLKNTNPMTTASRNIQIIVASPG